MTKEKQNQELVNTLITVAESSTNIMANPGDPTFLGVNTGNRAFPGWGRSWNLGFTYRF